MAVISVQRTDTGWTDYAGGYVSMNIFGQGYVGGLGGSVAGLVNEGPSDVYVLFNSGDNTSAVFAMNISQPATGAPIAVSNIRVYVNPYANLGT